MTYPDLLSAIYTHHDMLLKSWEAELQRGSGVGVLAFLPAGYMHATGFDETHFAYWTLDEVRRYVAASGNSDEGYMDLVETLVSGEEFLVLIVEERDAGPGHAVHIHRITRVGLN